MAYTTYKNGEIGDGFLPTLHDLNLGKWYKII